MNVMHQTSSASSCISFRLTTCQRLLMTRCFVSLASSLYGNCSSFWASIFLRPHSVLAWAECQAVIFARYLVSAKSRLMIEATHFASAESEICTLLWSLVHGNMHSPTNSYYRGLLWVLQFFNYGHFTLLVSGFVLFVFSVHSVYFSWLLWVSCQ